MAKDEAVGTEKPLSAKAFALTRVATAAREDKLHRPRYKLAFA
jgi:hypothetical protein